MSVPKVERLVVVVAMLAMGFTSTSVGRSGRVQSVEVTPDDEDGGIIQPSTDSIEVFFVVRYLGDELDGPETFNWVCSGTLGIACDPQTGSTGSMEPSDVDTVTVLMSTSSQTGDATVTFDAIGATSFVQDGGSRDFHVGDPITVTATTVPSTVKQYSSGDTATFAVTHTFATSKGVSFQCSWGAGSCSSEPVSASIGVGDTASVSVIFEGGAILGPHQLSLLATSSGTAGSGGASVTVTDYVAVTASAIVDPVYSDNLATDTAHFFVRFPGQTGATFDLAWTCGGELEDCPSPSDTTVGDEGLVVPVIYTSGPNGDTSAITLTVTKANDPDVVASATLDVIVTNGILFTVDDANPGLELNRGDCLNVSAGAISIVCDDVQYVYPFMPVMRMNTPRQVGLIFNGGMARPGGVVGANFVLPAGETEPDSIRFNLDIDGTEQGTWTYADGLYEPGVKTRVSRPWSWVTPYGTQLRDYVYTMTPFYGASPD
jgi:hypothetical protein